MDAHFLDLALDVQWLVTCRHFGDAWQVHQSQVDNLGRVDLEHDGHRGDVLVATTDPVRIHLDLVLDLREVVVLFTWFVHELSPFNLCMRGVNQLDLDWSASHDAVSTGQEIPANDGLKDAALARGLAANHDYLRNVDIERHFGSVKYLLEFTD